MSQPHLDNAPSLSLIEAFSELPDPRSSKSRRHPLINIVVIAVCAVLCGADNWVAVESWAKSKERWLKRFLDMSNGVPSHDTFGRVFSILSPDAMQRCFVNWTQGLGIDVDGRVVAIDGKTMRRSHDRSRNRSAVHMVNAWCTEAGVALGQVATAEKSNEITAIPQLLELLYLKGAIVTVDAMGCQRDIAEAIRAKEADYVLAVKANQPRLLDVVKRTFADALEPAILSGEVCCFDETERTHGREVRRIVWSVPAPKSVQEDGVWAGIRSFVFVESFRTIGDQTSLEHRYYISSCPTSSGAQLANAVRQHWGVENGLHWVLDVAFREDEARMRIGHAAENMSRIRQMTLNMLKMDRTMKVGIKTKRLRAGWDDSYFEQLLRGFASAHEHTEI